MTKADIQEALVALYLRLNGYFTTGFVVQSSAPGRVTTELDPWNRGVDFIVGEVKSHGESLQFNPAVRNLPAVSTILQWWGHLTAEEVSRVSADVLAILNPLPGAPAAPTVLCPRDARVRAILF